MYHGAFATFRIIEMLDQLSVIQKIAVFALPMIFAITLHEVAHGWVAYKFGDDTAYAAGRLSLNPIRHIDPLGTIIVPLAMYLLTGFIFGWAKPVPVNFARLRNPRRDMGLVAFAGPAANLLMAILWALILRAGLGLVESTPWLGQPMIFMGYAGILINAFLMILNLIPIPPLDGGRVLTALLPPALAEKYAQIEPVGIFILLGLLMTGLLDWFLWPGISLVSRISGAVAGLI